MTKKLLQRKQLLIDTLSVQTSSGKEEQMIQYIINFCIKNVPTAKIQVDNNNIYVTKGDSDIYPCIVSHTDTVHDIHKHYKVFDGKISISPATKLFIALREYYGASHINYITPV